MPSLWSSVHLLSLLPLHSGRWLCWSVSQPSCGEHGFHPGQVHHWASTARDKELDAVTKQQSKINSTGSRVGLTVMAQSSSQFSPRTASLVKLSAHPACKHTESELRQNVLFQRHTVHFAARCWCNRSAPAGDFCAPACSLLSGRKSILMPRR